MVERAVDRRAVLRVVAVGGALTWTAPAVQVLARPAFAQGTPTIGDAALGLDQVGFLLTEASTGVVYRLLWESSRPSALDVGPDVVVDGLTAGPWARPDPSAPTLDPFRQHEHVVGVDGETVITGPVVLDVAQLPDGSLRVRVPEGVQLSSFAVSYGDTSLSEPGLAEYAQTSRPEVRGAVVPGGAPPEQVTVLGFPLLEDLAVGPTGTPTPATTGPAATGTATTGG